MTRLFTYFPIIGLLLILFLVEESILKWVLLILSILLIVLAKYIRTKQDTDEVEYDDRVNANITKWSLRLMFVFNSILLLLLLVESKGFFHFGMNFFFIYLALTLFIPFYIAPLIIKRF
ncbi:hypothetical protein ACFOZY_01190 [Chungangia koreensis]|uniref:Group-specific protein n=1 Tax=Chungangia koreensis TaxID=752657 RepID=A0ABV8X4A3_9LACT